MADENEIHKVIRSDDHADYSQPNPILTVIQIVAFFIGLSGGWVEYHPVGISVMTVTIIKFIRN